MRRAFIGTGLIGGALAEAACGRGEDEIVVWNRTAERARPLEARGARVAETAPEAVRGAARVHLALTADQAVDAVLADVADRLSEGAIVIDHSTTSPPGAAARAARCAERGVRFLHAPVFMSPAACRAAKGVMVVAGPEALHAEVADELSAMTGEVFYVGDDGGHAAAFKLIGNCMILALLGGLTDAFAIARAQGIALPRVIELFEHFDLRAVLKGRGARMAEADWTTSWTLAMARKDLGLMVDAAGADALGVLPAMRERMDALLEEGEGEKDVGIVARDVATERG
ncbi:MAG TPA: NAD(P)-binding domain-containing protein [Sandaracinaceae bacterium LLY-WYZ-13_1]|nr:NAD(P)-binding domain-containing protein [Sandaracinaceae bacterium LLY-WYZ-13_1]